LSFTPPQQITIKPTRAFKAAPLQSGKAKLPTFLKRMWAMASPIADWRT
jgi:hypothetical protein